MAITGQVPTTVIGTDAFQETPIVEICRAVTKHHYLVTDANDIPGSSRKRSISPRPDGGSGARRRAEERAVDRPRGGADFDPPMQLPGYHPEVRPAASEPDPSDSRGDSRSQEAGVLRRRRRGQSDASAEYTKFAKKVNIPVAMTVMGLGGFPGDDPQSLHMLGMHGNRLLELRGR